MPNSELHLVLSDFDGVIARRSTAALLEAAYTTIYPYQPMPFAEFRLLFRSLVPFPLQDSLTFLLRALGLTSIRGEIIAAFKAVEHQQEDMTPFLDFLDTRNMVFGVLSSSFSKDPKLETLKSRLGSNRVIAHSELSKVNPSHFLKVLDRLGVQPAEVLYVDDCPMALVTAKLVGMGTVMMPNAVFTREEAIAVGDSIDLIVDDFWELASVLRSGRLGTATDEPGVSPPIPAYHTQGAS